MDKSPEEICESILGATIQGIRVDENSTVILTLSNGFIEFEDVTEMYVEINELDS